MKLGIINSAFVQTDVDAATGLEHSSRIGFERVEEAYARTGRLTDLAGIRG